MVLQKKDFVNLSLLDLLINTWDYASHNEDFIIRRYLNWNIDISEDKWQKRFLDFKSVIEQILNHDPDFNLRRYRSENKHESLRLLKQ